MDIFVLLFILLLILAIIYAVGSGHVILLSILIVLGTLMLFSLYYSGDGDWGYGYGNDDNPRLEQYLYDRMIDDIGVGANDLTARERQLLRRRVKGLLGDYGGALTERQYSRFAQSIFDSTFPGMSVSFSPPAAAAADGTGTPTPAGTGTGTPTPAGTGTGTPTPAGTGTGTPTPAGTGTGTGTPTPAGTGTGTPTPAGTGDDGPTPAGTGTPTPAGTGTPTPAGTVVGGMMDYGKWIENNDEPVERLVDSQKGFVDARGISKKSTVIPDGYSYVTDGYTYLSP